MGCACNKQKSNGLAAKRLSSTTGESPAEAQARQKRESDMNTRAQKGSPAMSGRTQSFALEHGGKTARFGSRLERDAAAARTGGNPL